MTGHSPSGPGSLAADGMSWGWWGVPCSAGGDPEESGLRMAAGRSLLHRQREAVGEGTSSSRPQDCTAGAQPFCPTLGGDPLQLSSCTSSPQSMQQARSRKARLLGSGNSSRDSSQASERGGCMWFWAPKCSHCSFILPDRRGHWWERPGQERLRDSPSPPACAGPPAGRESG